jgi:hypothetical protein
MYDILDLPAWNDCSDREIGKPKWSERRNNLKVGRQKVHGHKYIGGTLSLRFCGYSYISSTNALIRDV